MLLIGTFVGICYCLEVRIFAIVTGVERVVSGVSLGLQPLACSSWNGLGLALGPSIIISLYQSIILALRDIINIDAVDAVVEVSNVQS